MLDCAVTSRGPVTSQAPQADAPITVWVKRMDVPGAQYVAVKGTDVLQTVDDFKARWVAQAKLDVDPSLVTLRLVKCGARKPAIVDEAKAEVLDDPRLTLAAAGLTDGCSLLAFVVGTKASAELVAHSTSVPGACIARISLPPLPFAHNSRECGRRSLTSCRLCSARRELRAQRRILPGFTRLRAARLLRGCRSYGHVAGVALAQNGSQQVGWRDDCKRRHCSFDDHHRHSQGVFGGLTCQQPVRS